MLLHPNVITSGRQYIISGRSPPLYCTLTLISMQGHQNQNPFNLRVLDYSVVIWSYSFIRDYADCVGRLIHLALEDDIH